MTNITDLHNHILYGVDDGAASLESSMEIIKREYEQGVRNIIFTPHFHIGECMPEQEKVESHFDKLKKEVEKVYPDMALFLGNEIMACNDMVSMLEEGKLRTLAGSRYVLVEFYPTVRAAEMEKYLRDLLNGGYIPIIAHCERYSCLRKKIGILNKEMMKHFIEMGVFLQVNASSVFGRDKKFVSKLIQENMLYFIGTDAHSTGRRGVFWEECIEQLQKKCSQGYIRWLLEENPKKVIDDKYMY